MCAPVTRRGIEEWSLDMDTRDNLLNERGRVTQHHQSAQTLRHNLYPLRDASPQNPRNSLVRKPLAGAMQVVAVQVVAVEIHTDIAVHLQIEVRILGHAISLVTYPLLTSPFGRGGLGRCRS